MSYKSTENRIEELRKLEAGWLDGDQGSVANQEGLSWLQEKLFCFEECLLPWIFPTVEEEDILLEWSIGDYEIGLWINTKTKQGSWYSFSIDTCDFEEHSLDLSIKESWFKIEMDLVRLVNK